MEERHAENRLWRSSNLARVPIYIWPGRKPHRDKRSRQKGHCDYSNGFHSRSLLLCFFSDTNLDFTISLSCRIKSLRKVIYQQLQRNLGNFYQCNLVLKSCLVWFRAGKETLQYLQLELEAFLGLVPRSELWRLLGNEFDLLLLETLDRFQGFSQCFTDMNGMPCNFVE